MSGMSTSSKSHYKLQNSKNAAVSLDSLLGVLASAYGTEELDSNTVFDTNTVDWRNISVENFQTQSTKEKVGKKIEEVFNNNNKELERISVSTSTSNLKLLNNNGSKIDVTLASIKSLEEINATLDLKNNLSKTSLNTAIQYEEKGDELGDNLLLEHITSLSPTKKDSNHCEMAIIHEHCSNVETVDEKRTAVCGFFVNGPDGNVVFDIQFLKKVRNIYLPDLVIVDEDILITKTNLVNQTKSSFKISKCSLISKCFYFAEVDKDYGLENLEVCLKCNSSNFCWVVEWIKADVSMCKPNLCVNNIKDILFIAYHLKIQSLIEECLDFFHQNFKIVLEIDYDIEHLFVENLSIQFVKRMSNTDINKIGDEFECFQMKMFCALITLLGSENVCVKSGHYSTLATIFQCASCDKLLNCDVMSLVPCSATHTQIDFRGELKYYHECLPAWNLSKYVELMYEEFQNWKLVYWYLWGICHFLYCVECQALYPVSQSQWCPYHPNSVEYFSMNSDSCYPIGSYTCCGEKAFKFNLLKQYSGCKFKNHTPDLNSSDTKDIYTIYELNKPFISRAPPEIGTKKFLKFVKKTENEPLCNLESEKFWWTGIQLAPSEKKDYSIISFDVLNRLRNKPSQNKVAMKHKPLTFSSQVNFGLMPSCSEVVQENLDFLERLSPTQCKKNKQTSCVGKSKLTNIPSTRIKMKGNKSSKINHRNNEAVWSNSLGNKANQEDQRDFEEVAMTRLVKMLTPVPADFIPEPVVGTYVRLEAEWWRDHCADSKVSNAKISGTVVNRTFPLSWFRRPM